MTPTSTLYEVFSFSFRVLAPSLAISSAVDFMYEALRARRHRAPDLEVAIRPVEGDRYRLEVFLAGQSAFSVGRLGDLLHTLDNHITVAMEQAIPRYYFVHAAALAHEGKVTLIVGESGAGKSTTAYALASSGFDYLSDELSPIDPQTGLVFPYPRAFCLKDDPPPPLNVPRRHLRTEWTLHIQARDLPCRIVTDPLPLARIVFVRYSSGHAAARLKPVTPGEASLWLYKNALNQLAHPSLGLDDTLSLVQRARCLELEAAGIEDTVRVLREDANH